MWSAYANRTIYLDSNIIIYAIERGYRWADTTQSMLAAIDNRIFRAVTSELAIAEVLSKPLARGDQDEIAKFENFSPPAALSRRRRLTAIPCGWRHTCKASWG